MNYELLYGFLDSWLFLLILLFGVGVVFSLFRLSDESHLGSQHISDSKFLTPTSLGREERTRLEAKGSSKTWPFKILEHQKIMRCWQEELRAVKLIGVENIHRISQRASKSMTKYDQESYNNHTTIIIGGRDQGKKEKTPNPDIPWLRGCASCVLLRQRSKDVTGFGELCCVSNDARNSPCTLQWRTSSPRFQMHVPDTQSCKP